MELIRYKNKDVFVTREADGTLGKTCSTCNTFKPYTEYCVRHSDGRNYLYPECNVCKNASLRRSRRTDVEGQRLSAVKERARRQGWEFDLEKTDLVSPEVCPILGIPLTGPSEQRHDNTCTVDRVDTTKGYTKDNIVLCSWRANKIKSDATFEEIEKIYLFMKERLNQ